MRKEVKLGMAIGGGVVGLLVVYLLVAPPGNAKKGVQLADASAGGNGNGSLADPVTLPDSSSQSNQAPEQSAPVGSEPVVRAPEPVARRTEQATHGTVPPPPARDERVVRMSPVSEQSQPPRGEPAPTTVAEARPPTQGQAQPRAQMYFDPNAAWGGGVSGDAPALGITRQAPTPSPSPKAFVREPGKAEGSATAAAAGSPNTHVVKSGETFSSIAQAVYGSAAYYPHLIRANPGVNPNNLKLGTVLNVPPVSEVKASGGGAAAEKAAAGQIPAGPRLVEEAKIDPVRQYRVVSGDSLYKIGQKLYGKGTMGDRIYEANKQLIGADARRLKLGMILQLPEPPTAGASARRSGDGGAGQEVWNSVSANPSEPYFGNEGERK